MKHKKGASDSFRFLLGIAFTVFLLITTISIAGQLLNRNSHEKALTEHWAKIINDLNEGRFTELPYPGGLDKNVVFAIFSSISEVKPERRACRAGCVCGYNYEKSRLIACEQIKISNLYSPDIITSERKILIPEIWISNTEIPKTSIEFEKKTFRVHKSNIFFVTKHPGGLDISCQTPTEACRQVPGTGNQIVEDINEVGRNIILNLIQQEVQTLIDQEKTEEIPQLLRNIISGTRDYEGDEVAEELIEILISLYKENREFIPPEYTHEQ
jgi:hypothetical protein